MRKPAVIATLVATALGGACKQTPKSDTENTESTRVQQEKREPADRANPNAPALGGSAVYAVDAGPGSAANPASSGTTGAIPPAAGSGSADSGAAAPGSGSAR